MSAAAAGGAVELTLSNSENWSASTAFGDDWAAGKDKIVTIPSGVTIGGTGSSAAMTLEAGMGGTLIINNSGDISGYGGAANGGVGGTAIKALTDSPSTITVNNLSGANIRGGGGGGGQGGAGGKGGSGAYHAAGINQWNLVGWWLGGPYMGGEGGNGGAGGAGGQGYGYGNTNTAGSNGAAGAGGGGSSCLGNQNGSGSGSFACYQSAGGNGGSGGTGGAGGSGGAWGTSGSAGSAGSSGAAGNNDNTVAGGTTYRFYNNFAQAGAGGSAGSAGGLAGYYIENLAYVTLNNSGTVAGR